MRKDFPDRLPVEQAQARALAQQLRQVRGPVCQEKAAGAPFEDRPLHRHRGEVLRVQLLFAEVCEETKSMGSPGRAYLGRTG